MTSHLGQVGLRHDKSQRKLFRYVGATYEQYTCRGFWSGVNGCIFYISDCARFYWSLKESFKSAEVIGRTERLFP